MFSSNITIIIIIIILLSLMCIAMDISADLMELGRTPVTVVCAGVKSILDIEKTLEYLVG